MRPLLAAAASEGPSDTAGSSDGDTSGASQGLSHQRSLLRAIQLAVVLLFQVQACMSTNMPRPCTAIVVLQPVQRPNNTRLRHLRLGCCDVFA